MSKVEWSKFKIPAVIVLIVVFATAGLLFTKPKIEEEKDEFPALSVEVVNASRGKQTWSSRFQGEVRAKTNIELVAQVAGKVVSVSKKYTEGAHFDKDEVLLVIDDADYKVALRTAEAAVAEARVQLEIERASAASSEVEWRDLQGKNVDLANPLRLNKPQVERAQARLSAAQAQLTAAKLDVGRTTIKAPFSCRVQNKTSELGQFINRGSSVARIFATDVVEIRIPMSDMQITELGLMIGMSSDDKHRIPAGVTATFGGQQRSWTGYLNTIDASVDPQTRLLYATVVVEDPFNEIKTKSNGKNNDEGKGASFPLVPGLFVDVELQSKEASVGLQIPRQALRNGNLVYVVVDNKISRRQVKPVYTSDEIAVLDMSVDNEIKEGDAVVVSSVPGAYDGMAVKIKGEAEVISATSSNETNPG